MTELILYLVLAGALLGVLPQLIAWLVAERAYRLGSWWPILLAVPLAAICYAVLARALYSPDTQTFFQGDVAAGRVMVEEVGAGALIHAGLALGLHLWRLTTGK